MKTVVESTVKQQFELGEALLAKVGNTPLLRLRHIEQRDAPHATLLAKAEWYNPAGSVKDRPALRMIEAGERSGALTKDKIILDATSGNTGIAYAMIGAIKGYRVRLAIPSNVSEERKRILNAYGAELIFTSPLESTDGAIREVKKLYAADPERYFFPDQYNNPENWKAHYETTGPEIWEQTQGQVTHLVAGLGTSGTLMGTGRRLKVFRPDVRVVALEPDAPFHGLEGLKYMASAIVPGIYDAQFPDEHLFIPTEDAYRCVKRLAREEGLLVGPSSGAALAGALRLAQTITSGVMVMIFPDGGSRYLSDRFWDEPSTSSAR